MDNTKLGDCKCWVCGVMVKPTRIYGPLRCKDHLERQIFHFERPTQEEMEALFSDKRGMTCM